MAKYPIRITFPKAKPIGAAPKAAPKPVAQNRPAPAITQKDLDRHARTQASEARESLLMRRSSAKPGDVISVTTRMKETPVKKKVR